MVRPLPHPMNETDVRQKIIDMCIQMNATGLNQGTSGNISAVLDGHMLITPSGIPYEELSVEQIAKMPLDSANDDWLGPCKPSSEWHFHRAILRSNPTYGAVVHTHSMYATILSMSRTAIPACHYMIAAFGGSTVRCSDYATFGTQQLSANILTAMEDRSACLMVETLSKQYYHAKMFGDMVVLPEDEMQTVIEKFKSYGPKDPVKAG